MSYDLSPIGNDINKRSTDTRTAMTVLHPLDQAPRVASNPEWTQYAGQSKASYSTRLVKYGAVLNQRDNQSRYRGRSPIERVCERNTNLVGGRCAIQGLRRWTTIADMQPTRLIVRAIRGRRNLAPAASPGHPCLHIVLAVSTSTEFFCWHLKHSVVQARAVRTAIK